jgi:hypothetical protein
MNLNFLSKKIKFGYFLLLTTIVTIVFLIAERHVRIKYPDTTFSMYKGITYTNVDNEYYIDPVENYLSGKEWRRNPTVGNGSYYRRTPGYSLFYLFSRKVTLSKDAALMLVVFLQFIFYLLFFAAFNKILKLLDISFLVYNISMLFMSVIPYFYHTIFGTNTESISVYLITFFICFILAGYKSEDPKKKIIFYVLASFFVGYATLTRPYLGIFLIMLPVLVFKELLKKGFIKYIVYNFLIGLIPILMIATWTFRNYSISKEIVFLETAYHPENLDRMKPEFRGFFNLAMTWAEDGANFNSYNIPLYFAALAGDTSFVYVENCIKAVPQEYLKFYGRENLTVLFRRYQLIVYSQKPYFDKQIALPKTYSKDELDLENDFNTLISKFKKEHFFKYYFTVPVKYMSQIIFHSNTVGIYFMQTPFRNHLFLNVLRYLSLLIHISLFFFILINFFTTRNNWLYFSLFFIIPVAYLLFFSYFVQSIEQRYYSPILPILIMGATYSINKIYFKLFLPEKEE